MRFLVDANVFGCAVNRDMPEHDRAVAFVQAAVRDGTPFGTPWNILYEFLRVTTHPRVFSSPLSSERALRFVARLFDCPCFGILGPTERHAELLGQTLRELGGAAGNFFHDIHTAVVMREQGVSEIITCDNGFRRFRFLRVRNPLLE